MEEPRPSLWQPAGDDFVVAVLDELEDEQLAAAIEQAKSTAEEARQRWEVSEESDRAHWAVKWAALTAEGGVEHVWVRPINWSPFRVEGTLVSRPLSELDSGKDFGDLASFPIEELSDWIHVAFHDPSAPREGGFTLKPLEDRFGSPQRASNSP